MRTARANAIAAIALLVPASGAAQTAPRTLRVVADPGVRISRIETLSPDVLGPSAHATRCTTVPCALPIADAAGVRIATQDLDTTYRWSWLMPNHPRIALDTDLAPLIAAGELRIHRAPQGNVRRALITTLVFLGATVALPAIGAAPLGIASAQGVYAPHGCLALVDVALGGLLLGGIGLLGTAIAAYAIGAEGRPLATWHSVPLTERASLALRISAERGGATAIVAIAF